MSALLLRRFLRHPQLQDKAAEWVPGERRFRRAGNLLPEVHKLMSTAHIFVLNVGEQAELLQRRQDFLPLAPPFPVCWFEVMIKDGMIPIFMMRDPYIEPAKEAGLEDMATGPVGMLVKEKSPGLYDVFVLEVFGQYGEARELTPEEEHVARYEKMVPTPPNIKPKAVGGYPRIGQMTVSFMGITVFRDMDAYTDYSKEIALSVAPPMLEMVNRWLQLVNEGVVTHEDTDEVVLMPKADRPHKKYPYVIRRIVRILPKGTKRHSPLEPLTPRGVINWTHRWEVRGHWRHVEGLGKDRVGDYVVPNFTWVKEHERGPADKELIVKTRILTTKGEKNG